MAQGGTSRRRLGRRLIVRFDGEGDDAALWTWLSEQSNREAAAKAALLAAATGVKPDPHGDPATLADQVAKLINILDRVTFAGGGAPRPIGMSLGPAEPIRPFQVAPRSDPPTGATEAAVAADPTTLDEQVDRKIAKLLRFGDDLFGGDSP